MLWYDRTGWHKNSNTPVIDHHDKTGTIQWPQPLSISRHRDADQRQPQEAQIQHHGRPGNTHNVSRVRRFHQRVREEIAERNAARSCREPFAREQEGHSGGISAFSSAALP